MRFKLISSVIAFLVILFSLGYVFGYDEVLVLDREPYEYRKMWITPTAVVQLNADLRAAAGAVFITVELNDIRYRVDGGDPDENDGHPVLDGQNLWLSNTQAIQNLRMISVGAGARIVVTYYR